MKKQADASLFREPGVRQYQVLCLLSLAVVFLADLQQGVPLLSLLLLLFGLLGVLSRSPRGPIMFLAALAGTQMFKQFGWRRLGVPWIGPRPGLQVEEVVLCLGALAYVVSHYRWQALLHHILPLDPRRREAGRHRFLRPPVIVPQRRSPGLVTRQEIGGLLLGLPLWVFLAQGLGLWLYPPRDLLGLQPGLGRVLLLAWGLGLVWLLAAAILNYFQLRGSSPRLSQLFLQDVLWKETRREQRRINRWLAWQRNR